MSEKKTRAERDYGLPRLTIAEAERVLGVTDAEFMAFLYALRPSPGRFSKWKEDVEPLPETLIRLYLDRRRSADAGRVPQEPIPPVPLSGDRLRTLQKRRGRGAR